MTSYCFSQNGYPKWIVYDEDTIIAITETQLDKVNIVKIERDACYDAMWESSTVIDSLEYSICEYKNVVQLQRNISHQKDSLISEMNTEIKNNKKENRIWKFIAGGSIVVNAILILLLL